MLLRKSKFKIWSLDTKLSLVMLMFFKTIANWIGHKDGDSFF